MLSGTMVFKRYLRIGTFLLVCCCGSQSHSEVPDLPSKNVLEIPDADPRPAPTMIGRSWTPEQQQVMNDLKNRLTDRICDIVDDVLKPYALAHMGFAFVQWSVHVNFWLDRAGRTTRVTFDGTSTRQDLDRSLLSSMQRIDLKREIPSWLPMPVRSRMGRSDNISIGGCRLKSLRST
jgi:hypothetical protein